MKDVLNVAHVLKKLPGNIHVVKKEYTINTAKLKNYVATVEV